MRHPIDRITNAPFLVDRDPDGAERRQSERGNAWEVHGKGTAGAFGACGATQATPAIIYTDLRPGLNDLSRVLKART